MTFVESNNFVYSSYCYVKMYKKELEKKQREEQEATAHAFHEFIKTFQDVSGGPPNKLFVRSGILNGIKEEELLDGGKIYNPTYSIRPNAKTLRHAIECATLVKDNKLERTKSLDKPKSNLELLKEELRLRQLERNEKLKHNQNVTCEQSVTCPLLTPDQNSTNLFVANINPKITEQDLIKIFGDYGPLASVKIMWPKHEDKTRSNCGFVAYMSRKDGERALQELKNYDDMRIGWGKPIEIPSHPIYIPPELLKLLLPPPYTGLPFNAQPINKTYTYPKDAKEMDELLYNSYVKVTIPLDRKLLMLIHRTIEYVVNEGPLFEAIIMNKELNNPSFQFLFDNKSPSHIYYRWKLYSILNGENPNQWCLKKFRMFDGGSIWIPPVVPDYTKGMPDNLIKEDKQNLLSIAQRNRLIQYVQNLTIYKKKIGEVMVFCLNHVDASQEITELIHESLSNPSTSPVNKIARLYLVSDILRNCLRKNYTKYFVKCIANIFVHLKQTSDRLPAADQAIFRAKTLKVLKAFELFKIFPNDLLIKLEQIFNGTNDHYETGEDSAVDEPLDGKNLIKRFSGNACKEEDGVIVSTATTSKGNTNFTLKIAKKSSDNGLENALPPGFVPSKWETIDPEDLEAQAMSTKKFYDIEMENRMKTTVRPKYDRIKLRQVELEVMKYQDELESGCRKLKRNRTIEEQVNDYRDSLLKKSTNDDDSSRSSEFNRGKIKKCVVKKTKNRRDDVNYLPRY